MKQVLSIAGSDSCGGAGLQADLKIFSALGVDGATVVTAVTAQNTTGVRALQVMPATLVTAQMDAVFEEMDIRAVKLGMLANADTVRAVAAQLQERHPAFVTIDPVLVATSGARLLDEQAVCEVRTQLLPLADCLTPNLAEAATLLDTRCAQGEQAMAEQGRALLALGARAVLMKGGHAALAEAVDLLVTAHDVQRFAGPWINTSNVHGTGCMLSAGITASISQGYSLAEAVERAKAQLGSVLIGRQRPQALTAVHAPNAALAGSDQSTGS